MNIKSVDALNAPALEQDLGYTGLDSWCKFIHDVYGYNTHRLVAYEKDLPVGALVFIEIKHPFFGHYLTTAPYGSYGGVVFKDTVVRDALLKEAELLAIQIGVKYVIARTINGASPPPKTWVQQPIYCTYQVVLSSSTQDLLASFSANHRNHIRKSQKSGIQVCFGHMELLDDAYQGLSICMHELGSPYHGKSYLRRMAESLGNTLEFAVLYDSKGKVAGSGVFITQGKTISNLHAIVRKEKRSQYAGELLYWSVIEHSISKKLEIFDLGRSLIGSGNETFKLKWAKRKVPLAYWYWLAPNQELPSINQHNPKFQAAISIWKRLPDFIVNTFGTYIIRGLA